MSIQLIIEMPRIFLFINCLLLFSVFSFIPNQQHFNTQFRIHRNTDILKFNSLCINNAATTTVGDTTDSFVSQKNVILLQKFLEESQKGNLSAKAKEYVNFCDESFNVFLNERISALNSEAEKQKLGKIRYEINIARRKKLIEADVMLRDILSGANQKAMEAKLYEYLKRADIDMAFMVILHLNIEDALSANATSAVEIMKHISNIIQSYQDEIVSAPVHLVRLLVRENDKNIRKQMLRQKILLDSSKAVQNAAVVPLPAAPTTSPQCEHIVVQPVNSWGGQAVLVEEFDATIKDVLEQMTGMSGQDEGSIDEIQDRCAQLGQEVREVLEEHNAIFKSVEKCDNSPPSSSS